MTTSESSAKKRKRTVDPDVVPDKKEKKARKTKPVKEVEIAIDEQDRTPVEGMEVDTTSVLAETNGDEEHQTTAGNSDKADNKTKKKRKTKHDDESEDKHTTILSKFRKAVKPGSQKQLVQDTQESPDEAIELRDLVPIPQPQQPLETQAVPTFSALPSWLTQPVRVSPHATSPFITLGVGEDVAEQLKGKGFTQALAVQTAVLPLLLPVSSQHPGDVCVSAATGSGKTLAYVLPMVQDLKRGRSTSLRAIIVVPTRELVTQVQEVTRICVAGTSLQVGTAVGSHTMKAEQDALVRKGRRYDPVGYQLLQRKLERKMAWKSPDAEDDEDDVYDDELEIGEELADAVDMLPDHVPEYTSKVDILICTPGRLVDHLKSTRGFSLHSLRWLVIDEADRLLDQSFQEWADTLNKALEAKPTQPESASLQPLFPPSVLDRLLERVRKVILSATMTRDLDKLGSLNLWNPKLVLLEGSGIPSADTVQDASIGGMLSLPPTLEEHAVPVGDGSRKPLYLLQLLLDNLGFNSIVGPAAPGNSTTKASEDSSSSEGSSSDSSSDSSDSEPDSDSDSDSASDSSSASSSSSSSSATTPLTPPTTKSPPFTNVLIFTSSTESATRLTHLLSSLHPSLRPYLANLTKSTSTKLTARILSHFRTGALRILIATDRASRGLDLPGLAHVINYDVPRSLNAYVHRVGRTARAGMEGQAWTLVGEREAGWFWNVVARAEEVSRAGRGVKRVRVDEGLFGEGIVGRYENALEALGRDVKGRGT